MKEKELINHVIDISGSTIKQKKIFTALELLNMPIDAEPFLLQGLIRTAGLMSLTGGSDVGKSSLLRQLAIHIVNGHKNFIGLELTPKYRSVLIVETENIPSDLAMSLKMQTHNMKTEKLNNLRFLFEIENVINKIDELISEQPVDAVLVDCFGDVYMDDLMSPTKVRKYLSGYHELSINHNCLIVFLHHNGKRTDFNAPSKDSILGSQAFEAKMRLILELKQDNDNSKYRHLCVLKGNFLSAETKKKSIILQYDEETLTFSPTGLNANLTDLKKSKKNNENKEEMEQFREIVNLKSQGMIYDDIAKKLGFQYKSRITKILDKGKKLNWPEI